ncbi:hypothetical protein [Desulfobacterium sp. N47]
MDDIKNILDDEDEIIELTETAEAKDVVKTGDEDEIIELAEAVEVADVIKTEEDEIIELTDVEVAGELNPVENDQDIIIKDPDEDICSEGYEKDDFVASLGMEIDSESGFPDGLTKSGEPYSETKFQKEFSGELTVSPQQVEAAVERVVRRLLGDKIDSILIEVIERAVTQEIVRLKKVLRVNEEDFD